MRGHSHTHTLKSFSFAPLPTALGTINDFFHDFSMIFHASNLHKSVQSICDNKGGGEGREGEVSV